MYKVDIGMMVRVFASGEETRVQSEVESYQRLKKWYLMPPCLTLSIIRYGSRVEWINPGNGLAPSSIPWCSSYRKGNLRVTFDYGRQIYFTYKVDLELNNLQGLIYHKNQPTHIYQPHRSSRIWNKVNF